MLRLSNKTNYINRLNDGKGAYKHEKSTKFLTVFLVVSRLFGEPLDESYPQVFNKQGVSEYLTIFTPGEWAALSTIGNSTS